MFVCKGRGGGVDKESEASWRMALKEQGTRGRTLGSLDSTISSDGDLTEIQAEVGNQELSVWKSENLFL